MITVTELVSLQLHRRLPTLNSVASRLYSTLQLQLWELLPHFLDSPSDFEVTERRKK